MTHRVITVLSFKYRLPCVEAVNTMATRAANFNCNLNSMKSFNLWIKLLHFCQSFKRSRFYVVNFLITSYHGFENFSHAHNSDFSNMLLISMPKVIHQNCHRKKIVNVNITVPWKLMKLWSWKRKLQHLFSHAFTTSFFIWQQMMKTY